MSDRELRRDVQKLAKIITDHSRQIKGLSGGPQAAYSSIEGGSMDAYDNDGKMRLRIGAQDDGTHAVKYVQGPPPPRPTAPVVSVDGPVVRVRWDGMLLGGHIPEDFSRIDVHFALATDDIEDAAAVRGNLATSAGNETVLAATQTGTYRVGLVAMSQSRARSEMSEVTEVEVELVNLKGAIDTAVDNASGGSNHYRPAPPEGTDHTENDLWFDTSADPETGLTAYTPHRWDEAAQEWVSVGDQRTAAIQDAQDALRGDVDQIITDGSGATTYWLPAEPDETTEPTPKTGDIWFNTSDGNKLHRFDGQGWVSASDSRFQTIQDAQDALEADIDSVRTSVDGKNAITQSIDAPPSQYDGAVGDRWERMSSMGSGGSLISNWRWNGDVWVSTIISDAVLGNVDAAKIGTGYLDADRIEAKSITGDKLIIGGASNMIANPSFEDGTAGWVMNNMTTDESVSHSGTVSAVMHEAGGTKEMYQRQPVEVVAGDTYRVSVWARVDNATGESSSAGGFRVHSANSDGSPGVEYSSGWASDRNWSQRGWDTPGEWFWVTTEWTAPVTDQVVIRIAFTATATRGDRWVDDFAFVLMSGTTLIQDGAITTDKIQAGAITAESGIIGSLDAGTITVGEMNGARIKAGSITADKVLIGGGAELIDDAFLGAGDEMWNAPVGGEGSSNQSAEAAMPGRSYGFKLTQKPAGTSPMSVYAPTLRPEFRPPVEPGQKYQMAARVYATGAQGDLARISLQGYAYSASGSYISNQAAGADVDTVAAGEWLTVGGTWTAPDDAYFASPRLTLVYPSDATPNATVFYVGSISVKQQVGATLIEDGAVTTRHIETGSITAESGIIGSLDAGVITVGEMNGARIEAGTVDTPQLAFGAATGDVLSVDALNFKTAVGLDIRGSSFRAGDAVEVTEDFGIRQFGPDGALNVSLPSDGSPAEFRGDLSARTLTATGRMSIQGPGAIASGGVLELESGVVPPVGPPSVSNSLQTTKFPPVADDESVWGLAWAGGSWWRGINKRGVVVGDRIERISPAGELEASFSTGVNPQGLTSIGDELFLLGTLHANSQGIDQVLVYSLTGTLIRRWEYPFYGTGTYQPGIGTDGTNILIAQPWQDGRLTWRRFNKTTGALLAQVDSTHKLSADVVNILITQADYGTQRVIVTTGRETGAVEIYTPTGTHIDYGGWYAAGGRRVTGTAWASGKFHHSTAAGDVVTMSTVAYPNGSAGPDTNDWWAMVTWATGSAETTAGPPRRFTYMRRTDLRVTFGTPPEGATLARVYFARGVTEPGRAAFRYVGQFDANVGQALIVLPLDLDSRAQPPVENSFPQSTPGLIRSGLGNYWVDGTGAGRWGPLTFHADGTMTSDQIPEWIPVTTFTTGFGPQTWGFVPAYRIWPDGKVEWRGVVAGTINGTVTPFNIPAEARPAQPVNKAAAASGSGGTSLITRIEFGSVGDPDKLRVYRGDSDRTWVSLDDTSYYLV